MAVKLRFDSARNIIWPIPSLLTRGGRRIGGIKCYSMRFKDSMENASELSFSVNKNDCIALVWEKLVDFKLIYLPEWKQLFDIKVTTEETPNSIIKNITGQSLGESELSQINVYGVEINTEDDIERDDYKPTTLYNENDPAHSLLDRLLEKAPHYKVAHVDWTIASLQRTFSFDDKDILSCLREVCEEIQCHLDIECYINDTGEIVRKISLYDLLTYCKDCKQRGEFADFCDNCGSKNLIHGYGEDTTIFCSTNNLADSVRYYVDADSTKNCFYMSAGDDLMTSTIASCNPNGTGYLWSITDECKSDMSENLANRLTEYDKEYDSVYKNYTFNCNSDFLEKVNTYNRIVSKYLDIEDQDEDRRVDITKCGFSNAVHGYYNAIDFCIYLRTTMLPSFEMERTSAEKEISKLIPGQITVGVKDLKTCSASSVDSAVISLLKTIINCSYKITLLESSYENGKWSGKVYVENYGDEDDNATSGVVTYSVNDDYIEFTKQKVEIILANADDTTYDISSIFKKEDTDFKAELKKYGVDGLKHLRDVCQGCIDVLIKQGASTESSACGSKLYDSAYVPFYNKLTFIEEEMLIRDGEIGACESLYSAISEQLSNVQKKLNFEAFLGDELLLEFSSYRREESYKNDNYISDGLNNAQLIENALDFINKARTEIKKAAAGKHQIEGTLRNILAMKEFAKIVEKFSIGNWIHVQADGKVYKLRLVSYEINAEDITATTVEFSDVSVFSNSVQDVKSILSSASSMSTSYGAVMRQAKYGYISKKKLDTAASDGIDVTDFKLVSKSLEGGGQNQEWGANGLICRDYDENLRRYDDNQLKLLNNGLVLTKDNWKNADTVIGQYQYEDPETGEIRIIYGVNANLLIGDLILGRNLIIKNEDGTFSVTGASFGITNGTVSFKVDADGEKIVRIAYKDRDLLCVNNVGKLLICGDGSQIDISANQGMIDIRSEIIKNRKAIKANSDKFPGLQSSINSIDSSLSNVAERVDKSEEDIAVMADAISDMSTKIDNFEQRISALEGK